MGFIGGGPAYWLLKTFYPGGMGVMMPSPRNFSEEHRPGKLERYFGTGIFEELRDKVVIDFGCGPGQNSIELAQRGCRSVIGLDILEERLQYARSEADRLGLNGSIQFTSRCDKKADVIISTDAFEHFDDPAGILREMRRLLKDDGYLLIGFGYTWYHPVGGHLFSVFPWAHLIFTERSLIRWRSDFKTDGATRFHEVDGGLNQITLKRWERIVAESDFRVEHQRLQPIRAARALHNRLTREIFTSTIHAKLVPR